MTALKEAGRMLPGTNVIAVELLELALCHFLVSWFFVVFVVNYFICLHLLTVHLFGNRFDVA